MFGVMAIRESCNHHIELPGNGTTIARARTQVIRIVQTGWPDQHHRVGTPNCLANRRSYSARDRPNISACPLDGSDRGSMAVVWAGLQSGSPRVIGTPEQPRPSQPEHKQRAPMEYAGHGSSDAPRSCGSPGSKGLSVRRIVSPFRSPFPAPKLDQLLDRTRSGPGADTPDAAKGQFVEHILYRQIAARPPVTMRRSKGAWQATPLYPVGLAMLVMFVDPQNAASAPPPRATSGLVGAARVV